VRVDGHAGGQESVIAGSAGAVVERLLGFRSLGFDALSLIPVGPNAPEQAERLGQEVLPALRAAA
jgi:alkanesulfonate monooxygenase SsuD/methylene tetrahydromethanopterin reductase-like flavin-dependent oxidoreductase (luciferase family)